MKLLQSKPLSFAVGKFLGELLITKDRSRRVLTIFNDRNRPTPASFRFSYACVLGFAGRHGVRSLEITCLNYA